LKISSQAWLQGVTLCSIQISRIVHHAAKFVWCIVVGVVSSNLSKVSPTALWYIR
uniref:Ovule protein n=1 Tax=Haemonchus placei TaxID=6290 RepID=A0A0N4WIS4_HAEPC